jgi:competence protein ComEC
MTWAILAFAAGVFWLQSQASLPDAELTTILAVSGALLLPLILSHKGRFLCRLRPLALVGSFLLGIAWAAFMAQGRLADELALDNEGRDLPITGVIADLPQRLDDGVRFDFAVEQAPPGVPATISLAWYAASLGEEGAAKTLPDLRGGQRWQWTVRLKRPHGNINPHGNDYEGMLFERGVRATGYVRTKPPPAKLVEFVAEPGYAVARLRQYLRDRMLAALPSQSYIGVLVALAIGDQRAIDGDLWRTFANTGLTHLMSISGLHVTMVAALVYWIAGWLWRRSPALLLRLPAQQAAAVGGMLGAFAYCLLAGYQVPAQRTFYMLSAVAVALWSRRNARTSAILAFALLVVLLLDPWAVQSPGFWLSFGAVAVLLLAAAGQTQRPHWLREWLHAQWAVTVGMLPALLVLFQQFSLVSPLANAVAIPVVSLVVTPLTLIGCVLPAPLDVWLLTLANAVMGWLMWWVDWLAGLPWAIWQQAAPPWWLLPPAMLGVAWMLMPAGFPARWVGAVMLLPLLLVQPPRPPPGDADVVVLDVGEGLAVHVQTATHDLLFDTGPAFSADANSGNRIIVPYLRAIGVGRLDALVLSHEDGDHAGGAQSVIDAVPIERMIDTLPKDNELAAAPVPHTVCADGLAWQWDGVAFAVLYPPLELYASPPRKSNDMSCVLKVTTGHGSVLLTADIEAGAERRLLAAHPDGLRSDAVVPPHHGSRSSSTAEFVAAAAPHLLVIPVGYRNRFHHPDPAVLMRYSATAHDVARTDNDGAVTVRLRAAGIGVVRQRTVDRRYWHGR